MILVALLLLDAPVAQGRVLPPSREQQVDTLHRRMKMWRGGLKEQGRSDVLCETRRSTGDAELDAIACDTLVGCAAPLKGVGPALPPDEVERNRAVAAIRIDIQQCADRSRRDQIADLADRRMASTTE